jgi:hypothetical protein
LYKQVSQSRSIGVDSVNNKLVLLDPSGSSVALNTVLERTGFALEGFRSVTTITRVYPHIEGNGNLFIQFGSQDYAGAPVRWKPALPFNPANQRKVDLRTTGELHCWRITSDGNNRFEMSGMDIEYVVNGVR